MLVRSWPQKREEKVSWGSDPAEKEPDERVESPSEYGTDSKDLEDSVSSPCEATGTR